MQRMDIPLSDPERQTDGTALARSLSRVPQIFSILKVRRGILESTR